MAVEPALPRHRLPSDSLRALARGDGGPETVARLLAAESSRRLVLLRALDEAAPLGPAYDLLARAQRRRPEVVEDLLRYPQTGMWLAFALRRLRGSERGDVPLPAVLGYFSSLAAVAALRAGLDCTVAVPVRAGLVLLPGLGAAGVPARRDHGTARIRVRAGRALVEAPGAAVAVPPRPERAAPGWYPLRTLAVGPAGRRLRLVLDDLDPYRTYPHPSEPARLPPADAARWRLLLDQAWRLLLRDLPEAAAEIRQGLRTLTPAPPNERFRPRSVTAGDAFGGVEVSLPDDPAQFAATLVHEFQHTKLGGLLHLAPLLDDEPEGRARLRYAPWRDDPRPLEGLLQGVYAFSGVARFWQAHRRSAGTGLAHFEFAVWSAQVRWALESVRDDPRLTALGREFLGTLGGRCAEWRAERVPPEPLVLSRRCSAAHRARWRAHHLRPDPAAVEAAVREWLAGADRPPPALAGPPAVVPDPAVPRLDGLALLVRHRLGDPDGLRDLLAADPAKAAATVTDALAGDALLAAGRPAAARQAYLEDLAAGPRRALAWAGLGGALDAEGAHPAAARLLLRHPERAVAVDAALRAATGRGPDPLRLATWLGQAP